MVEVVKKGEYSLPYWESEYGVEGKRLESLDLEGQSFMGDL